jgi:hypothetical protein
VEIREASDSMKFVQKFSPSRTSGVKPNSRKQALRVVRKLLIAIVGVSVILTAAMIFA